MSRSHLTRSVLARLCAFAVVCLLGGVLQGCGGSGGSTAGNEPNPNKPAPGVEGNGGAPGQTPFASSFFTKKLSPDAPIDADSAEMVKQLTNLAVGVAPKSTFDCPRAANPQSIGLSSEVEANCKQVIYPATVSGNAYSPPVYTVPADQPRVKVTLDNGNMSLARAFAEGVPIPDDAQPASGTDHQMIVWQPSTDTMWDLWLASREADGWHAGYGGRVENVSQSPGYYQDIPDPNATGQLLEQHSWGELSSGMPDLQGLITPEDLRSGTISHALGFATWVNAPGQWVFPAQRTDGHCQGSYCSAIPQGARFRLDPSYDVSQIQSPIVRMLAQAAQDYGMVLENSTGSGVTFYAEGWRGPPERNPYKKADGLLPSDPNQLQPYQYLREFPWADLEMLKRGTTCTDETQACPEPSWWQSQFDG